MKEPVGGRVKTGSDSGFLTMKKGHEIVWATFLEGVMELSDEQKTEVAQWVSEGAELNDVQKRIEAEFKIRVTYMDVRFLILDLDLEIQEEPEPEPEAEPESTPEGGGPAAGEELPAGAGSVSVSVDKVVAPGAAASGTVTFSDGVTSPWVLDQSGRLGLNSKDTEYQPSPEDVEEFQAQLGAALRPQ